jgi:solute carrier family 25 phosphate transporter 23/24/25/41
MDNDGIIDFNEWRQFLRFFPKDTSISCIYEHFQMLVQMDTGETVLMLEGTATTNAWKYLLAGGMAGAVSRTATAPLDRLKVHLQTSLTSSSGLLRSHQVLYNSLIELYKQAGIKGFFRGNGLNIVKIVPESAVKFYTFEMSKRMILNIKGGNGDQPLSMVERFLAGGLAGLSSQFVIYPLETLKTRVMTNDFSSHAKGTHSSVGDSLLWKTALEMWRSGGIRSFYRGLGVSLAGIFPFAGIDLAVYETMKNRIIRYSKNDSESSSTGGTFLFLGCGMVSASMGAIIVYPISLIRTR